MKVILNEKYEVIDIEDYPENDKIYNDKKKDIELLNRVYT